MCAEEKFVLLECNFAENGVEIRGAYCESWGGITHRVNTPKYKKRTRYIRPCSFYAPHNSTSVYGTYCLFLIGGVVALSN